jgi:hypothetical protein
MTRKRKRPAKPRRAAELSKRKVSTRLTTAELAQLDTVAARWRVTRSEALRRCVLSEALRSELPSGGKP